MKFSGTKAPGRDYVKVICDVCFGQFYQKDTVLVTDKYNYQYGKVVCFKDLDKINEQVLPVTAREKPISQPEILRPQRPYTFAVNELDDRLPSAPLHPYAQANPIADTIDLYWQGPESIGSSGIIGYKIVRASQIVRIFTTVEDSTSSGAGYYNDTTADTSLQYIYKVAAINSFGTGPYSVEFYWPKDNSPLTDVTYLIITPQNKALTVNGSLLNVTGI